MEVNKHHFRAPAWIDSEDDELSSCISSRCVRVSGESTPQVGSARKIDAVDTASAFRNCNAECPFLAMTVFDLRLKGL